MKVTEIRRDADSDVNIAQTVYAIIKKKHTRSEKMYYLIKSESGHLMWEDASRYKVLNSERPSDWICVQNKKNIKVDPVDRLNGDGSVIFSCYMGPPILMNPIDNLVKISNVDAALSQAIIEKC